jgi:tetratricopeptide (TPR) repeat protein
MPDNPRIEELRRRVDADPASVAFAALAEEFRRAGNYQDAIQTCRTGLQRHPSYISARVTLGRSLIEVGEYEAARAELEGVLRAAPENLAAIRAMAEIHDRFGQNPPGVEVPVPAPVQSPTPPLRVAESAPAQGSATVLEATPTPPPMAAPAVPSTPAPDAAVVHRLETFLTAVRAARATDRAVR